MFGKLKWLDWLAKHEDTDHLLTKNLPSKPPGFGAIF